MGQRLGEGLTPIPEHGEAQAGGEQQEETMQTQPRARVDFGECYTHPIHHHCLAYRGRVRHSGPALG